MAIVREMKVGNTRIIIHDDFMPKTEEEDRRRKEKIKEMMAEMYIKNFYARGGEEAR